MISETFFRAGGFYVATCCALFGGPAAIASAQPSEPHQRVAPATPAKPTANASSPTGLKTVIQAEAANRLHVLQGQQAKLQQSTVKIEGAEQTKLAKEKEALVGLKSASTATHLQASAANQQLAQAINGFASGAGGSLQTLSTATRSAEQADAAALQAQASFNEAARQAANQSLFNTLTADLLNVMAKIEQSRIDTASAIARG